MPNVEIYIEDVEEVSLVEWISSMLEGVTEIQREKDMIVFSGVYEKSVVPVIIQKNVEDLNLTGVWFNSEVTPWASDIDCAREAHRALRKTIQCDSGDEFPHPNQLMEISEIGERLLTI